MLYCSTEWSNTSTTNIKKATVMTYKCMNHIAPSYLSSKFVKISDIHNRRTRNREALQILFFRSASGARLWNNVSPELRQCASLETFKEKLKSHILANNVLIQRISSELPPVYEWLCSNKLTLNLSRTKYLQKSKHIAKLKRHVTVQTLVSVYCALVHPYSTYGCILWGNNYEAPLPQLVKLQNKAIRIINNVPIHDHVTPHYVGLGLIKLPDIFKLS
ncbi:hypothetical protein pdam_00010087, partial [Pocillopora damicornis]